jgi:hypothetical protein
MEFNMAIAEQETTAQMQAASLWQFVHLKTPLFPHSAALSVIQKLDVKPGEDLKLVAKRLRKGLEEHGVRMPHTSAINAAAKIAGFDSWHDATAQAKSTNRLTTVRFTDGEQVHSYFDSWVDVKDLMCKACDDWHAKSQGNLFGVKLTKTGLFLSMPVTVPDESGPRTKEDLLLLVCPTDSQDSNWLDGANAAIETLRRRLEETGKATLDGVAVTQFCDNLVDAINAELVLNQSEHELDTGFEVARGDEVECWAQMDLVSKTDGGSVELEEDTGAWKLGGRRFLFDVVTLRPNEFIPGLEIKQLPPSDSAKLFRRYRLLKLRSAGALPIRQGAKKIEALGAPAEAYRIDTHRLLLEMNKKGLTWEGYCGLSGHALELTAYPPLGFLLPLLEQLGLPDPNVVFARPNRAELSKANDLKVLRTILPRANHVRYRLTTGLDSEVRDSVKEAIEELSSSIAVRGLTGGTDTFANGDHLSHMVFAYDADELVAALAAQDLVVYAGLLPYLKPIENEHKLPNLSPFAFGLTLYLDIDLAGSAT